jgi:hypothetical protein
MTKDDCECGLTKFSREQEKNLKQNFGINFPFFGCVYTLEGEWSCVFVFHKNHKLRSSRKNYPSKCTKWMKWMGFEMEGILFPSFKLKM